jgi:hypothetical protein
MDGTDRSTVTVHFEAASGPVGKKPLLVDVARYQHLLDESGLSDTQKEQVLMNLLTILIGFVDLGFSLHPLEEDCGKVRLDLPAPDNLPATSVGSGDHEKDI